MVVHTNYLQTKVYTRTNYMHTKFYINMNLQIFKNEK